ncbi:GH39 family glycosyl hydrolase [Sphingomonas melonis]|uniref:Xylan 1,4-beta-xylosidase n=1 Tax=Sphingomonas melonis TaxID=152682 RepID=A0A7Y9FKS7_9SPHN|nr:glycosyl hydrolase [Sphingomonas melonis]NYD89138.1 xylan 1,4-beta-xylosidase [Sphingomonas melonis]
MATMAVAGSPLWAQATEEVVEVDLRHETGPLDHIWSRCAGSDRASITLRESWRHDLDRFRNETGLQRVRFHGIFNDDLGVWPGGLGGREPNWQNVDAVYDGLLERGVQPFVELSYMPKKLASGTTKLSFTYNANITPPTSAAEWASFVQVFVRHLIDRYGAREVRQWYFEVWNEPNLRFFWSGTQAQYFEMYKATSAAIKAVDPALRVGGPSTAAVQWMPEFLAYCEREGAAVDFVSTHIYAGDDQKEMFGQAGRYSQTQVIPAAMAQVRAQIDATKFKGAELWLSEWSSDSPAMIAHIITQCLPYCHAMSQWALSNVFEEINIPNFILKEGDGGWGMLAQRNIARPSFNTYKLLHRLGQQRLQSTGPALASRTPKGAAVLAWNLAEVQQPSGIPGASTERKVTGGPRRLKIALRGAKAGASAKLTFVDQERGSPLPKWRALGSPQYPTRAQIEDIRRTAELPSPETRRLDRNGELQIDLPPEGVVLIEI